MSEPTQPGDRGSRTTEGAKLTNREPCMVCWGKGEWPAISDREWAAHGGRRGPDYIQRCGYCRGTGLMPVSAGRTALAQEGGEDA